MRIYKNDIIKASAISTGADRGVLPCSITDSGFTSIAGVISAVKDRLPNEDHKRAPACEGMRSLYLYNA